MSEENSNDNNKAPYLIYDDKYRVKCCLAQLNEIQYILPPNKDIMYGVRSSNYGIVRPLLREIYLQGQIALPELIDYFDSESYLYSITAHASTAHGTITRVTLGMQAKKLFIFIIDPTGINSNMRAGKDGKLYHRPPFSHNRNIKEWYQKNRDKSLLEIQQEVVDYYIQQERNIGFPDKESEQEYLVPLLELRRNLPRYRLNVFYDPPMPTSRQERQRQIQLQQQTKKALFGDPHPNYPPPNPPIPMYQPLPIMSYPSGGFSVPIQNTPITQPPIQ